MIILGIETSARSGSLALQLRDGEIVERAVNPAGRKHAQALLPGIKAMLEEHELTVADCEAIAVSIGPGSFTGLRIGVVCAKTFAYVTGCRVLGVDTLMCAAARADAGDRVWSIADAQRGELFVGRYQKSAEGWTCEQPIEIHPAESWCETLHEDDVVVGPAVSRFRELLEASRCRLVEPEKRNQPSAAHIVGLAASRLSRGESDDLWSLEPRYHRRSAAEEKWDENRRAE